VKGEDGAGSHGSGSDWTRRQMPTKNERLSLLTDGEEITAVKAPPPGLLRESKVIAVAGSAPIKAPSAQTADDGALTPAMIITEAPLVTAAAPSASGRVAPGRTTPATGRPISATLSLPRPPLPAPAAAVAAALNARPVTPQWSTAVPPGGRVATPAAPMPAALARMSMPVPIPPTLVASYQRPVVDLVPVSPGAGAIAFAPPALFPSPARSRAGLYAVLIALLAGGAGMVGWRQWSARPARVDITTTPADAIITVGGDAVAQHSPYTLERPPGSYEISVAREGFQQTHRTVELLAGQEVALAIALEATHAPEAPPPAAPVHPARATSGQGAARHAPSGGGSTAIARHAPAASATAAAAADPGIAAMLARSHPLRDLSGAPVTAQAGPEATTAPVPEATAPATAAIPDEPEPAAAPARAAAPAAAAAVAAPTSDSTETDRADARTVPGRVAKAQLAIDPNAAAYRVALPPSLARAEMKLAAVVKICVSADGKVTDVKLLKSADPAVDPQIPQVLSRWRFRPLLAAGRAVPFCYVTQYEISEP